MPVIRVLTNVPESQIPENFEVDFTHLFSETSGKPVEVISLEFSAGARLFYGGTRDPFTLISIKSIGAVSAEDNIRHTKEITKFCREKLGIDKERVQIDFTDFLPTHIGWNGTTVADADKDNGEKRRFLCF